MANAKRDQNNVPTLLGVLDTNGTTLVRVKVNPTNHGLEIDDDTTGTDHGPTNAPRDENFVTALIGVSSADGTTPVAVYADSDGNLLIDSS